MGLFLHAVTSVSDPPRPRVSSLAVAALIAALLGFLTAIGFFAGIVLGHIAIVRIYLLGRAGTAVRGRRLAITALWVSYLAVLIAAVAFIAMLVAAYAALPSPPTLF